MNKVIFLDIDGVLIPGRSYYAAFQTKPLVTIFDPCVVGMLNYIAEKAGYKFVIHSSWLRSCFGTGEGITVKDHMITQGLKSEYFHKDDSAKWRFSGTRWIAITDWLYEHPEVIDYWILEDEQCPEDEKHLSMDRIIKTEFDEGLTVAQMNQILNTPEIVI